MFGRASKAGPVHIAGQRLVNQHLVGKPFETIVQAVGWFGAMQAQEYPAAKWAIGQRVSGITDAAIDREFDRGAILRTHVMRPTWHFVLPADIRWLLELTAPRVNAASAYYYRQLELDAGTFRRSNAAIAKALRDGKQLTRAELALVLSNAGIAAVRMRLGYLMIRAELDAVICSGARRGKQFTYALLDERAPGAKRLDRDEALVELVTRYFTSHGPAQVQDFVWWSGLTSADTKRGIEIAGPRLAQEVIDDKTYWFAASAIGPSQAGPTVHLLPTYDEYVVAYRDKGPIFNASNFTSTASLETVLARHILVVNGQVLGGWRSANTKGEAVIDVQPLGALNAAAIERVRTAAKRYGAFMQMPIKLRLAK